jgi:hypothetical protein
MSLPVIAQELGADSDRWWRGWAGHESLLSFLRCGQRQCRRWQDDDLTLIVAAGA